jgi:hypothetical protein
MDWLKQSQTKSQLGQLLLKKKLISEDQLNKAIDLQRGTGQLLGDIFTQLGIVSQRQIQGMLRRQRNIRRMATIVTALLAPIQVYAASAAPIPIEQNQTSSPSQHGLRMLNEQELSDIAAQGILDDALSDWLNLNGTANNFASRNLTSTSLNVMTRQISGLEIAGLVTLMDPLLTLLTTQTDIKDVVYDPANAASAVNSNGTVTLSLPSSVGELSFQNIRLMGSTGPSLGTIFVKGINLAGTTVMLKSH